MALSPSTGYAPTPFAQLDPDGGFLQMFEIERVQLQFQLGFDFVAAQVANNVLVLALSNNKVLRIDLERPEDIDGE